MWRLVIEPRVLSTTHVLMPLAFRYLSPTLDCLPPGHVPFNVKQTPLTVPQTAFGLSLFTATQTLSSLQVGSTWGQHMRPAAAQVRCQSDPKLLHSCPSQPGQSPDRIHSVSSLACKYTPSPFQFKLVVFKMSSVPHLSPWLLLQQHSNRFPDIKSNFLESTSHRAWCSQKPLYSVSQPPGSLARSPAVTSYPH